MNGGTNGAEGALPRLGLILLVGVTLGWGLNWVAMKIALAEVPPWTYRALLLPLAGPVLLVIAGLSKLPLKVPRRQWAALAGSAFFNVTAWQILAAYGISLMAAGRAGVIAYTMPLWASVLGVIVLGEVMTVRRATALALGMAGVGVLLSAEFEQIGGAPLGIGFMLAAAAAWGIGVVWLKKVAWAVSTLPLAGWQLVVGCIPMIALAPVFESVDLGSLSAPVIGAFVFTFVWPICFCHWAFFKVVSIFPASVSAIGTLLVPVIGVVSGALVLGEPLGWRELTSLVLVCAALSLELLRPTASRPAGG